MRPSGERKSLLAGYVHSSDFDLFYIRDIRDIRRNILPKLLYGDAMLVLTWMSSNMADGNQQKFKRTLSQNQESCMKISFQLL